MKKTIFLLALMLVISCLITSCGVYVRDGCDANDSADGFTPSIEISEDGYWVINGVKTEYKAVAEKCCSGNCSCCNTENGSGDDGTNDPGNNTSDLEDLFGQVMIGATDFLEIDISEYSLPSTVTEAYLEASGLGYIIMLETKGYGDGMTLIVGVSLDGVVTGATCVTSNETNGVEKSYGENFVGKDMESAQAVDLIAGSTKTTLAYRTAVIDAINAATIFGGYSD